MRCLLFGVVILRREPLGLACGSTVLLGFDLDLDEVLRLFVISISRFIKGRLTVDEGSFRLPDNRLALEADFWICLLSLLVAQAASVTVVSLLGPRIRDSKSLTRALASIGVFLLNRKLFSGMGVGCVNELDG